MKIDKLETWSLKAQPRCCFGRAQGTQ